MLVTPSFHQLHRLTGIEIASTLAAAVFINFVWFKFEKTFQLGLQQAPVPDQPTTTRRRRGIQYVADM